jgi:lipid-A-disaccharide synthase
VDYPGFNLRLAAELRKRGLSRQGGGNVRVLYYISPQIWAWRAGRRFAMARNLDAMGVIFPFEPACYADTTLPVEFVGHPFVAPDHLPPVGYAAGGPILLLPGSRQQAVRRIFPVLLAGFREFGRGEAVVLYPSEEIRAVLQEARPPPEVRLLQVDESQRRAEPIAASAVLTSSGTMSMHCALAGIPGAIAYRANPFTYLLGRMLVQVESLGIANLLLREPMYPEYLQGAATAAALAAELRAAVDDPGRRERAADQAARLRKLLAVPASGTAGEWLARQLAG